MAGLAVGLRRMKSMAAAACAAFLQVSTSIDVDAYLEVTMAISADLMCVGTLGALWGLGRDADTRKQRHGLNGS